MAMDNDCCRCVLYGRFRWLRFENLVVCRAVVHAPALRDAVKRWWFSQRLNPSNGMTTLRCKRLALGVTIRRGNFDGICHDMNLRDSHGLYTRAGRAGAVRDYYGVVAVPAWCLYQRCWALTWRARHLAAFLRLLGPV